LNGDQYLEPLLPRPRPPLPPPGLEPLSPRPLPPLPESKPPLSPRPLPLPGLLSEPQSPRPLPPRPPGLFLASGGVDS